MSFLLGLVGKFKIYLIVAGIAFSAGAWTVYKLYDYASMQAEIKGYQKAIELKDKAHEAAVTVLTEHHNDLMKIEKDKINVPTEVIKYVKVNPECNLTIGAALMLNRSRTGVSTAATFTDGEKQATSTITQGEEVNYHAKCGIQYRELASQLDRLIDFIQRD